MDFYASPAAYVEQICERENMFYGDFHAGCVVTESLQQQEQNDRMLQIQQQQQQLLPNASVHNDVAGSSPVGLNYLRILLTSKTMVKLNSYTENCFWYTTYINRG